jgi:phospholipid-binding lipoprotein MlaA
MRVLVGLVTALSLTLSEKAAAQVVGPSDVASATTDLEAAAGTTDAAGINDPLEGFNRAMFSVNNVIDDALLVPLATGYRFVTTSDMRSGLRNMLSNAGAPVVLLNDLLQAKPNRALETTARFVLNSSFGVAGLVDVAAKMGIPPHSEDFGQTLAVWGVGSGPYLYLPLFGPSSVRDGFGRAVDIASDPLTWIRTDPARYARFARFGATAIAFREPFIEPVADIKKRSLDPYASFRSFYVQSRNREIRDGVTDFDSLPDIGEYEELDAIE